MKPRTLAIPCALLACYAVGFAHCAYQSRQWQPQPQQATQAKEVQSKPEPLEFTFCWKCGRAYGNGETDRELRVRSRDIVWEREE